MSNCNCNTIVTNPCTTSTGCTSTNYSKCIIYSGDTLTNCVALTNGETLDVSLGKIVDAICALTPDDLSWNTFDYACLDSYSTAQEFAEGISQAHCDLVDRVEDLEKPSFTLCSLFQSSPYEITSGTTTLQTILEYYGSAICALWDNNPADISLSNSCFTELTTEDTLEEYLQWIINNTCSIKTALQISIGNVSSSVSAIQTYLGTPSTLASGHDNTDCLGGGSSDTAYDTIELLKDKVCELSDNFDDLPDIANIALSWAPCFYSNVATSLNTQLGRMVARIKAQNYQFDAGDFTVTSDPCGPIITLNGSNAFTCSDLNSCSIHALQDVTDTADNSGDTGGSLTYDYALGYYRPIRHVITVTTPATPLAASIGNPRGAEIVTTLNGNAANLSRNFAINFREETWLDLSSYAGTYIDPTAGPNSYAPMIMKTWDGQIKFRGEFGSAAGVGGPVGATGQPLNNDVGIRLFSSIPALYRPVQFTNIAVPIRYINTLTGPNAFYVMGQIAFDPVTGHIQLYVRDQGYLMANIDGAGGTDEYLGDYTGSLQGIVINY